MALQYPIIDPVAVDLGIFQIRWYALAYIAGFLLGWRYVIALTNRRARLMGLDPKNEADRTRMRPSPEHIADLVSWIIIGVILGGRLGYVLFYQPGHFFQHPFEIVQVWRGGMSFHGGFMGAVAAIILFARRNKLPMFVIGDFVAAAGPLGLCLGRLANFVNGELYGRASDAPWAMVFPNSDGVPRHPSQLYQAGLEGLLLFGILALLAFRPAVMRHPGVTAGAFLTGYGTFRIIGELFREPDPQLGFLFGSITMGQLLSLPMICAGIAMIIWAWRRNAEKDMPIQNAASGPVTPDTNSSPQQSS
jgi:phosphatidylglycerol---prolipoprotein diacylglyceryl transferase